MRKQLFIFAIALLTVLSVNAQNYHVQEDFNNSTLPTGWTNTAVTGTATWNFGIDGSATNGGNNNLDGTAMAYFDDDALGASATNNRVSLLTPVFNNVTSTQTTLTFDYNFRQFNAPNDSFIVEVFDGTAWVNVFFRTTNDCGNYLGACANNFPSANIDISAYNNANCQVRFTYFDGNDWCWYVGLDNVVISSPFPNDIGVTEILDPTSGCGLTSTQQVEVKIKNFGTAPASNFSVVFNVNGTQNITGSVVGPLAAGDSMNYTFPGTVNMSTVATYNVKAYTNYTLDSNNDNDSLVTQIENEPTYTPTFSDNFEGIDRWKVEGNNPSWQLGVPNNTIINNSTSGTKAYVTNLTGGYNNNELSYLVSPCFDFTSIIPSGDPIVTFNLNFITEGTYDSLAFESSIDNGLTWQKVRASANPTNWYNVGQHWEGTSGGWIPVENVLTGLAGQSSVKLRFKLQTDGNGTREGVAIDDFSIRFPQQRDISLNELIYPSTAGTPLCGYATENIIVELENKGAQPLDTVFLFYKVDNNPAVRDTFIGPITPNSLTNFVFTQKANFSVARNYTLSVWTVVSNDGFNANDSILNRSVTGGPAPSTLTLPLFENFDGAGWVRGNASGGNSLIPFPWVRNPTPNVINNTWHPWNGTTGSGNTGPSGDHTGNGGNYMFYESSGNQTQLNGTNATLETPCLNLGNVGGAIMEFWYHKYGSGMGNLYVDVNDGTNWTTVHSILGQTHFSSSDPWLKATVNLNQYAGQRIKIRWRGVHPGFFTNDMAIDDVEIFEPIPQDGKIASLISPESGCTPDGNITIEIENFGSQALTDIPVAFSIDGGITIRDTARTTISPGAKFPFTFAQTANFGKKNTTYEVRTWTEVVNDSNLFNDVLVSLIANTTKDIDYIEDFESFVDGNCFNTALGDQLMQGWEETSTGNVSWAVHDVGNCGGGTPTNNTGPANDHSKGNGKLMYIEAVFSSGTAQLVSPCIDFQGRAGAAMRFWYHKFGTGTGTLFVDIIENGVEYNGVHTISGQTQTNATAAWKEAVVKFNQFGGKDVQIRFRGSVTGSLSETAIDDISFFAPYAKDARMLAVVGPKSGCLISDSSYIQVEVDNFGTLPINPDSLFVYYQVDNGPVVKDTVQTIIAPESTLTFTFTQPADLSIRSKRYNIKAWTELIGEQDVDNDTLFMHTIKNQTKITEYFENFERFRDSKCDQQLGQAMENGWTASSSSSYNWQVQSSLCGKGSAVTPSGSTGPNGDRTTGGGIFMFTEGNGSGTADLLSPCLDLTNNTNPRMSFYYHRYGSNMNPLQVDVLVDGSEVLGIASLTGQNQTSAEAVWKNLAVNLTPYAGKLIQLRFRSIKSGFGVRSDMAIDDFFLYEASNKDAGVTEVISPSGNGCNLTSSNVQIRVNNFGLQDIQAGELLVQFNNNGGPFTTDTIQQIITAGSSIVYTFDSIMDLSNPGRQLIVAKSILPGDTIGLNDKTYTYVENRSPGIPRYFMDFERHVQGANYNADNLQGFIRNPAFGGPGTYMWHVQCGAGPYVDGQPPFPPGPPTGPSGDHTFASAARNGKGCYMMMESDIKQFENPNLSAHPTLPDATLELPCGPMDFSNSENGKILLSYWYHMFGPETGNLYVDVHNGINWVLGINVIRGQRHSDDTDPWLKRQVVLDQFVGNPNVRIRFRAENPNTKSYVKQGRGGDMAIDDIEILDRKERDAAMVKLIDPEAGCMLNASEDLKVRIQNLGTRDIIQTNMAYQITFTPLGGDPIKLPIVKDSIIGQTIVPLAFYDFTFNNSINMSASGTYQFCIWTDLLAEENRINDTLCISIQNVTRPFPSCDNFSDLTFDDKAKDFKDGTLPNYWAANTSAYTFKASIEGTPDDPNLKGHTNNANDVFMLAFDGDGMPGQIASLTSPCFDLSSTPAANLEFYYQMPASQGVMLVEAREVGGAWQPLDTIFERALIWTKRSIVLADFVGRFIEFRIQAVNTGGGFYAIDDFCVVVPYPQQVALQPYISPIPNLCFYSDSQNVILRLRNVGIDRIDSFQVVLGVDKYIISNKRDSYFRDTAWVYPGANPPYFNPGDRLTVDLGALFGWYIDLSEQTDYYFHTYILLKGDRDLEDNERQDFLINHPVPRDLPYAVDFESQPDPLNGLTLSGPSPNGYAWAIKVGTDVPGVTGPGLDHTKGPIDSSGTYLVSQAAAGQLGETITVTSQCIDLQQAQAPELKYWYHMFGFSMGNLILQVNDDFGWVEVDKLQGEDRDQSRGGRTPWKSRIINLSAYKGKVIRYRFISERGSAEASDMALDDISVYDLAAKDISPVSLNEPNRDSSYCYSATNPLKINVINNGSDSLDFTKDTAKVTVLIYKDTACNGNFISYDTLFSDISVNSWKDANGNVLPIPRDSIGVITMNSTFDMSDTGTCYKFIVIVEIDGDFIVSNNILDEDVKSQRKTGTIQPLVLPLNDTMCFNDPLLLEVKDYFGALRWEEKRVLKDGSGFWGPAGSFPFDEDQYLPALDTTSDLRVRVCPQLLQSEGVDETTDSVRIEIVKPYTPRGFDDGRCLNDPSLDTIRVTGVSNITGINLYLEIDDTIPSLTTSINPFTFPLQKQIKKTDTFYVESIIHMPGVQSLDGNGLTCTSTFRDSVFYDINTIPVYDLGPDQTICADTTSTLETSRVILDGGQLEGRQDFYRWAMFKDGVFVDSFFTQTVVVDAYKLDSLSTYKYVLSVATDQGCKIPNDSVNIFIDTNCTTAITDLEFKNSLEIYPNPVSNQLNIVHKSIQNFVGSISLLTAEGQLIEIHENLNFGNLNKQIEMGTLPKGVYIIKIVTDKGEYVHKIIKS